MNEELKKLAYHCGAEAQENQFKISEYYEDFCLHLSVNSWREIPIKLRYEIKEQFKVGWEANIKARKQFGL